LLNQPKGTFPASVFSLSSDWLLAVPNPAYGQVMVPILFRAALALRMLIPFSSARASGRCPAHNCKFEGTSDRFGYHALSCLGAGNGMKNRHNTVVQAVSDLARQASLQPKIDPLIQCWKSDEKTGIVHLLRPADVLMDGDRGPQTTCVDVTVVSPLSPAKAETTEGWSLGRTLLNAVKEKRKKHESACSLSGMTFIPFGVDVLGLVDEAAWDLITRMASRQARRSKMPFSQVLCVYRRRISFAIQLGVARQLAPLLSLSMHRGDDDFCEEASVA
jgi:hypothetical protein